MLIWTPRAGYPQANIRDTVVKESFIKCKIKKKVIIPVLKKANYECWYVRRDQQDTH